MNRLAIILLLALATAVCGCSVLPKNPPRVSTTSIDPGTPSSLTTVSQRSLPQPELSGFALMPIASTAYQMRIDLAAHAEHTLDIQYYVVDADGTGQHLLKAARDAAARGVRVRLLVDDLYTSSSQDLLLALSAFDNVEVRLFNPIPNGRWSLGARILGSLFEFSRVNRRMHNKLFVADNAMAVMGGRNIGDEYFMRGNESNFVDIDILAAGPVVPQLSRGFDEYWNSELSYPVATIVHTTLDRAALRERFDEVVSRAIASPQDITVPERLQSFAKAPSELAAGVISFIQAPAVVYVDPVQKAAGAQPGERPASVRANLIELMRHTEREVFVISPYFIPGDIGIRRMEDLHARGVKLRLLTNSLAATDEPLVHIGYSFYRQAMLRAGVEIYELSPEIARKRNRLGRFGSSSGRLHAKVAVLDRRRLFIGSMNFDPRSEYVNTELGVVIDSEALAEEFVSMMDYRGSTYMLRLAPNGRDIEWVIGDGSDQTVFATEPETSAILRFKLWFLAPFIPEAGL